VNTMKDSRRIGTATVFLMAAMPFAGAQTQVDLASQSKNVDFSRAGSTKPAQVGPAIPGVCSTGQIFFDSSAPAGQNLFGCTATNIWSLLGGTGGGSGGGAGSASQLGDFVASDSSSTVQALGAGCSTVTPCQIRVGAAVFTMTAPVAATLTGTSVNGTVFWYLSSALILTAGHNSAATVTCSSGCSTVTGITAFPPDAVPLWQTTFTTNVWDPINLASMDKRAIYSREVIAPGSGVMSTSNPSTGVQTISTDPTQVPRYFAGSGAPSANCMAARDFYTDTVGRNLYFCDAANTWKQANANSIPGFTRNWAASTIGGGSGAGTGWLSSGGIVTTGMGSPAAYNGLSLATAGTSYAIFMTVIPTGWTGVVNLKSLWTIQNTASGAGVGSNTYSLACLAPGISNLNTGPSFGTGQTFSFNFAGTGYQIGQLDNPTTWTIPSCTPGSILYVKMAQTTRTSGTDPLVLLYFDLQVY
jgi:hypothetical protein